MKNIYNTNYHLLMDLIVIVSLIAFVILYPTINDVYNKQYSKITNFNIISTYNKVETSDTIVYTVTLPGLDNKDVTANIIDNKLVINYNNEKLNNVGITTTLDNIELPQHTNSADVTITMKHGVAIITIRKIQPVVIPINVNQ